MKRILRIGFIDYVLEPDKPGASGLSDIVWEMASSFVNLGHDVHIIASYHSLQFPDNRIKVHNFQTPPIGYRNIIGYFWILHRAAKIIRTLSLDILHAPEYFSTASFSVMGLEIPLILTVPGNIYERIENGNPFDILSTQVLKASARISAKKCAHIIVTSNKMEKWWAITGVTASRMTLIPYGVNTELFRPISKARTELNIHPDEKVLLYVGRLSSEKGLVPLLSAMKSLCEKIGHIQLYLIGTGHAENKLRALAHRWGIEKQVVFFGQINRRRLPIYYSAADVTILPSLSEGLPRTMIEALACESPFLGTKITGIEDHIQDQNTGYLVEPGNSAMLVNKIHSVLRNPERARMVGKNGASYIRSNLTWQLIAQRVQDEVYYDVVSS